MEDDDRLFFDRLSTFVGLPTGVSLAVVGGLQRIHRCVVPMELGNRQWVEGGDMIAVGVGTEANPGLPVTF